MEDDALVKKIMPHNLEAEQSVIGAMLMDPTAIDTAGEMLVGEDFYSKQNGIVYDAIQELRSENKPADPVTLSARLKEKGVPEEMAGPEFVRDIIAAVPTSANVKHYAQIVYEKSTLRRLIRVSQDISEDCYSGTDKLDTILENTEKKVFNLIQSRNSREFEPISEVVMKALRRIEEASKTQGNVTGIPTGFIDLDNMLSGLQRSDLVIVAARPSMGKTAFVLSIADYVAFRKEMSVAIFSLEMAKEQLVNRLFSMEAKIDAQNIRSGNLSEKEWEDLMEASETISASKIIIDDTPGISMTELRSRCRKYKLEEDIQMVLIDYIQLMSSGGRVESRQQEISEISRGLKALARELNVPVLVLSQLNRAVDTRSGNRPVLSDIRESGSIEQDADVIMFLYRDDYYNPDTEKKNVAEVIVAKQRNGPVGTIELTWQPKYTRFVNTAKSGPKDGGAFK
ncbi:MAG: replicative DNA helicase [Lachnospiraceae bacterium]|nr:replicative DNA helicase [Lachnospiraceae bacterium]MBR6349559.1 replicative DNA helicase [Lachnospiraceae bacterium]